MLIGVFTDVACHAQYPIVNNLMDSTPVKLRVAYCCFWEDGTHTDSFYRVVITATGKLVLDTNIIKIIRGEKGVKKGEITPLNILNGVRMSITHTGTNSTNLPLIIDTCRFGIGTKPPTLLQVIKQ